MYYHSRKTRKRYNSFPAATECHFCDPQTHAEGIALETAHAHVVINRTFYDQWELRRVVDHLLVLPKRHVLSLQELNEAERLDIMNIIADYEGKGYEIYARSPVSHTRSVPHQHTHLIKTGGKTGRGLLFWRKPYILLRFR